VAFVISLAAVPRTSVAQSEIDAEAFVRQTYARYNSLPLGPAYLREGAPSVFTPSLVALIRHDQKVSDPDIGKLDFDPVCSCQDWDHLSLKEVLVAKSSARAATATVTFQLFGDTPSSLKHVRLRLAWLPQGWRIDDIESKSTPSLRKLLR
jgi:hypothetical protein